MFYRGELEMDREGGRWGSDLMHGFMNDMNDEVWKMVWKREALYFLLQIVFLVFLGQKLRGGHEQLAHTLVQLF